jgi:hypothetical protein
MYSFVEEVEVIARLRLRMDDNDVIGADWNPSTPQQHQHKKRQQQETAKTKRFIILNKNI